MRLNIDFLVYIKIKRTKKIANMKNSLIESIFKDKKLILEKLEPFGFKKCKNYFLLSTVLPESGFCMNVIIKNDGSVTTKVTDSTTEDTYTLHLSDMAEGAFVGSVRKDYTEILENIAKNCFEIDVFKFPQTLRLIDFIKKNYDSKPEYLWKDTPRNAVFRKKDNGKWFAAILTAKKSCMYSDSEQIVELVDFKIKEDELSQIADGKHYFRAYHMNKKKWCTVILDDSVSDEELFARIKESFDLIKNSLTSKVIFEYLVY